MSAEEKDKFPYDIVKMALPPEAQLAADSEVTPMADLTDQWCLSLIPADHQQDSVYVQVLGEHDDTGTDDLVEASANQELDKSPSASLRVQEAILKELTNDDVHKVWVYTHMQTHTHTRAFVCCTGSNHPLMSAGDLLWPGCGNRDGGGA